LLYKISKQLFVLGLYNLTVDTVIRDFFYESDKKFQLSSGFLHGQIEQCINIKILQQINEKDKVCEWTKLNGDTITIEIREGPDKLAETIENKISRKSSKQTPENVPYCVKLISDFKRNSLVFESEKDIYD